MKRFLLLVSLLAIVGALAWGGYFYWRNLRGVSLLLRQPKSNIVELFEQSKQTGTTTAALPLKLPAGFAVEIFAKGLGDPRVLAYDPLGNLLVSLPKAGKVVALPDRNGDHKADQAIDVVTGLNSPHGIAMRCYGGEGTKDCKLFIAETDQLAAYDYDSVSLRAANKKKLMDLPSGSGHSTRTVKVGPDERLYVSIGSSCNVCHESDDRRARIFSLKPDGSDVREVARGLRNSVFFEWSYVDGRLWATDMGRDNLGDDLPPDEINVIETGSSSPKNYGWPICYGQNVHDTEFDKNTYIRNPCQEPTETPSHIDVPAHSAPLGLAFVPEEGWPEAYWYNLFVAYHGSWNRSEPTGYKVVRVKLDAKGNYLGTEDFITGWLSEDKKATLGRPVDILLSPGGLMYLSDDGAGAIYRVTYRPE
jgi:glucose/arabinose dehydrogenase